MLLVHQVTSSDVAPFFYLSNVFVVALETWEHWFDRMNHADDHAR